MKTFFRVQNKIKKDDFTDFDRIEDARAFCDEWGLNEDTHQLEKWEPNKKSSHKDVQLSFIFHNDKPYGMAITNPNDPTHINMVGAMSNPHAAGKPVTVKKL